MSSCLTCRYARKPKGALPGNAECGFDGSAVAVSHVCLSWASLCADGINGGFDGEASEVPLPYNSRGTSLKLRLNERFIPHCEMQNSL